MVEPGQAAERGGGVGVPGAQRLLPDREHPLVQRLGLGVRTGGALERGEAAERNSGVGVLGAQHFFVERYRACGK